MGGLRCAKIAPKSNFPLSVVDGDEELRQDAIADSRLGDVGESDVEDAEVGAGQLHSRLRTAGVRLSARKNQRVGRGRIDDGADLFSVDGYVHFRLGTETVEGHHLG